MGAENTEKTVILLKNGAKFIIEKPGFRAILPSPEAKKGSFFEKKEKKSS